jgi:nucleotide-binding universal stress UspA family protein
MEREVNLLSTYLREVGHDVADHLGVSVQQKVVRGAPAARVIEEVESFKPDLLVISTHGKSGISRWRFGSVADKVIRGAGCNTLVIGPQAHDEEVWLEAGIEDPFKRILLPLDGSGLAETALGEAAHYAACFGSTLHLVRVVGIPAAMGMSGEGAYMPDLLETLMQGATDYVHEVRARLGEDVRCVTEVLMGDPATKLAEYAKQKSIDLIVMTSHGRGGFTRTALGSVVDRTLTEGTAPVLVGRTQP